MLSFLDLASIAAATIFNLVTLKKTKMFFSRALHGILAYLSANLVLSQKCLAQNGYLRWPSRYKRGKTTSKGKYNIFSKIIS